MLPGNQHLENSLVAIRDGAALPVCLPRAGSHSARDDRNVSAVLAAFLADLESVEPHDSARSVSRRCSSRPVGLLIDQHMQRWTSESNAITMTMLLMCVQDLSSHTRSGYRKLTVNATIRCWSANASNDTAGFPKVSRQHTLVQCVEKQGSKWTRRKCCLI